MAFLLLHNYTDFIGGSEASGDASPASAPGAATALRDLEPDAEAA